MKTDLAQAATTLRKGALFRIDDGQGQRVECLHGVLWLTQHSDPRDVILEAGEGFTVERGGATYLSALADSTFVVLRPEGLADATPFNATHARHAHAAS